MSINNLKGLFNRNDARPLCKKWHALAIWYGLIIQLKN